MFFQLPLSGVANCHAAFVHLCYGVIAKLLFHSVHHSGLPLPFVILINKNIYYLLQFREWFFAGSLFGAVVEM